MLVAGLAANEFAPVVITKPFLLRAPGSTPPGQPAPGPGDDVLKVCVCADRCSGWHARGGAVGVVVVVFKQNRPLPRVFVVLFKTKQIPPSLPPTNSIHAFLFKHNTPPHPPRRRRHHQFNSHTSSPPPPPPFSLVQPSASDLVLPDAVPRLEQAVLLDRDTGMELSWMVAPDRSFVDIQVGRQAANPLKQQEKRGRFTVVVGWCWVGW